MIQLWGDGDNWGNNKEISIEGTAAGSWHHYCLTYEGSWQLYFDAELVASGTPSAELETGTDYALRLGAWGASSFFAGSVDELYVSLSRVLLRDAAFGSTRGDQVSDVARRGRGDPGDARAVGGAVQRQHRAGQDVDRLNVDAAPQTTCHQRPRS